MKKQKLYKDVVPNPDFAAIEKEILAYWKDHNIFQKSRLTFISLVRIIPQAISVRYGLGIGASCAPLVIALMYIMGAYSNSSFRSVPNNDCQENVLTSFLW